MIAYDKVTKKSEKTTSTCSIYFFPFSYIYPKNSPMNTLKMLKANLAFVLNVSTCDRSHNKFCDTTVAIIARLVFVSCHVHPCISSFSICTFVRLLSVQYVLDPLKCPTFKLYHPYPFQRFTNHSPVPTAPSLFPLSSKTISRVACLEALWQKCHSVLSMCQYLAMCEYSVLFYVTGTSCRGVHG